MKLKRITVVFVTSLIVEAISRNYEQGFTIPPSFQTPLSVSSDNSLYLPLETQTSIPYFPLKTTNDLHYQYLPLTGTKAPAIYPSPYPHLSSSFPYEPIIDEEDGYNLHTKLQHRSTRSPPTMKPNSNLIHNISSSKMVLEKREPQHLSKMIAYNHPTDHIASKLNSAQTPVKVPIADRRVTKSTEGMRNDLVNGDQVKTGSQHEIQYVQPPVGFVSTTSETAIPILRLLNEMDLDGSYSYEALGADQTHYVQHSHIENIGTDDEEQVVEGSYSYVGDNGQTYTVHYVADANGFRASGDHLPVPPPVPEIIQRSIQYNLAQEANNPTHSNTWNQEEKYNDVFDNMNMMTAASTNRNLFTGRKPEAFSRNLVKHTNAQDLTVQPVRNSQGSVETQYEFSKEPTQHSKQNEPIGPQITFLASQGAHVPPISSPQPALSRMHTEDSEKEMTKLVKYEMERNDNTPQEAINKQLWRWQYGLTTSPIKTSISRSSSENDDNIVINFKDMTPEQYSNMLHSQFHSNEKYSSPNRSLENPQSTLLSKVPYQEMNHEIKTNDKTLKNFNLLKKHAENKNSGENIPYPNDWFSKTYSKLNTQGVSSTTNKGANTMDNNVRKKFSERLISQYNLAPQNQISTQSYDYTKNSFSGIDLRSDDTKDDVLKSFDYKKQNQINSRSNKANYNDASKFPSNLTSENNKQSNDLNQITETTTTTENTLDSLRNNIFLKKILIQNVTKFGNDKHSNSMHSLNILEDATNKFPKMINSDYYNHNDFRFTNRKPQNTADILSFVSLKNAFESNKIKPKKNNNYEWPNSGINTKHDNTYTQMDFKSNPNYYSYLNNEQNERLRGIVKIYKTLQRNNDMEMERKDKGVESRKDTSTDLELIPSNKSPPLGRAGPSVKAYSPVSYV